MVSLVCYFITVCLSVVLKILVHTDLLKKKILVHTDFLGAVLVVIVWQLDLLLPVQSVHITTKVEILNPTHGKVYSVQHYVKMILMTCGRQVSFTNKTDHHDITELLLKVTLNIILQTNKPRSINEVLKTIYHFCEVEYSYHIQQMYQGL